MKAYRMQWFHPLHGTYRVTVDCGINQWHAESGSRALLPGYQLVSKQYLGSVENAQELKLKWGQVLGQTCQAASVPPIASMEG